MPTKVFSDEEKERLKIRMLEQAFPLLEKYGLKHMSVDKITGRVGIGKSTVYSFFDSKEDYVSQALETNRKHLLDELDKAFPPGKVMKPAEVYGLFFETLLNNNSIYKKFSAEDEKALYEAEKKRGKGVSLQGEAAIAARFFPHLPGVKEDIDVGLVANYIKLIVLAYENAYLFHDEAMEKMQTELKMRLLDLIFEEEAKQELISLVKRQAVGELLQNEKDFVHKINRMQGGKQDVKNSGIQ